MANNAKVMDSIRNFLLKMKALDENIPEDLAKDALQMTEEVKDALCEDEEIEKEVETKEETKDECTEEIKEDVEDEDPKEDIDKKVEDAFVKVMRKYGLIQDSAMAALDEAEKELSKKENEDEDIDGEESVTVDPEKINSKDAAAMLRKVKPIIAGVKDAKSRKILADTFAKALIGEKKTTADYAAILSASRNAAIDQMNKKPTTDSASVDYGMEIAKKYNPHYKEVN